MECISKEKLYNKISSLETEAVRKSLDEELLKTDYRVMIAEVNAINKIKHIVYDFKEEPVITIEVLKDIRDALYEEDAISFKGVQLINQMLNRYGVE